MGCVPEVTASLSHMFMFFHSPKVVTGHGKTEKYIRVCAGGYCIIKSYVIEATVSRSYYQVPKINIVAEGGGKLCTIVSLKQKSKLRKFHVEVI